MEVLFVGTLLGSWMLKSVLRRFSDLAMGGKKRSAQPRMGEDMEAAITALDQGHTSVVEMLHNQSQLISQLRAELVLPRRIVDVVPPEGKVGRKEGNALRLASTVDPSDNQFSLTS